jgi:coatomer subunit alpha
VSVDTEKVQLPEADHSAVLLRPPIPASQAETNWPLLTVSKSFFEGAMASRNKRNINAALAVEEPTEGIVDVDAGGWGDDAELKLDDDGEERDEYGDDEPIAADGGENNSTLIENLNYFL